MTTIVNSIDHFICWSCIRILAANFIIDKLEREQSIDLQAKREELAERLNYLPVNEALARHDACSIIESLILEMPLNSGKHFLIRIKQRILNNKVIESCPYGYYYPHEYNGADNDGALCQYRYEYNMCCLRFKSDAIHRKVR